MKLKNVLVLTFLTLTLIPIVIVSFLLYKSGFELAKESYTKNLTESINVQADYISQTIENNMISDNRFVNRNNILAMDANNEALEPEQELLKAFQFYLENSEDKIAACILLNQENVPIYTIGEKAVTDTITAQLPELSTLSNQELMEFELSKGVYSLGIITPIWDANKAYAGSLISIYDKSYIFKIISSYYKIADSDTYICRENGDIINFGKTLDETQNNIGQALSNLTFVEKGTIDIQTKDIPILGYYKNISNSPWHLVGLIDEKLIYSFTNQFVLVYIFIIVGVLIVDVLLSFYFSQKVVQPINGLIKVMEGYQNSLNSNDLQYHEQNGYYETKYLRTRFLELMKKILLVQHNFEGIYQLYQSGDMNDTNIDIDVKGQTITSSKEVFQKLMDEVIISEEDCIVDKFIKCFCEKDQIVLTEILENMRDEHLSVACEAEIYTPRLDQKWFHTLVVPMYEQERLSRLFIQLRDISSFRKQEFESIEQARRDSLTGLYNRAGFAECVNKVLEEEDESEMHGLLFIDMDFFKLVNDNFGHNAGDELLCLVGKTLQSINKSNNVISRFGGDEFAVFLSNTTMEEITQIKEALNKKLVYPYHTESTHFVVSASIGVSTWNKTSKDTLEKLLQQADSAMYQAKRDFKENMGKS